MSKPYTFSKTLMYWYPNNTVRPKSVAGKAGHVRLERPIDSSSDKTVCAPKEAEKAPHNKCGILSLHPLFFVIRTDMYRRYPKLMWNIPASTRPALFPRNLGNSCGIPCFLRAKLTVYIPQFMPLIIRRHYHVTLRIMDELIF